jgi:hypothetical protein
MKNYKILFALLCIFCATSAAPGQTTSPDIDAVIERLNTETPPEPGCDKMIYALEDCTFSCSLTCGGNEFVLSFKMNDIQRVYKDKADLEDPFETLFFECKKGKNCIMSSSEAIPPSPVLPVRLPEDRDTALGDDALKAFSSLIESCQ